ncbi:Na+/H+ antiporter subunit E [Rarobacter incanus]|uniref:Multisubunit sodium/proton antiporter MrpE subunit n=1 Tax=Rarobacter incanus TaxID=153494 RepID=A0A542SQ94_9MICO|nr:Na+/H+ antiporter subunit E [Rarobacter incanus]TQK76790.1 multisubunit sodium/proton antiporter MrpE subunit [Rarobacter incanus]
MHVTPRRRGARASIASVITIIVLWTLLWGDPSVGNLLGGALIAAAVLFALPMTRIRFSGTLRPWPALQLIARFHVDLVLASWHVSVLAFRWRHTPKGAIIGVKLRCANDLVLTSVAQICALVPGTLVVDAHRLTGTLYLHVLDLAGSGGAEKVRADTLELEGRVLRAIGSRADLERAGLVGESR